MFSDCDIIELRSLAYSINIKTEESQEIKTSWKNTKNGKCLFLIEFRIYERALHKLDARKKTICKYIFIKNTHAENSFVKWQHKHKKKYLYIFLRHLRAPAQICMFVTSCESIRYRFVLLLRLIKIAKHVLIENYVLRWLSNCAMCRLVRIG